MKILHRNISSLSQEEFDNFFALLSPSRQNAVMRMRFEKDRKRSVLGESLVRFYLSEQLSLPPEDIRISRTENGKPYCENAPIHFSITHSKDLVVCVIHDYCVGVDVEFIRPLDLRITRFACTEKDMEFINQSEADKELRFFKLWTAKEAYIKFHGKILADLKSIDYESISPNCQCLSFDGYMATIYTENK